MPRPLILLALSLPPRNVKEVVWLKDSKTALHIAGNVEVVDYLLNRGLHIESCDENGYTPFLEACRHDRLPVVQHLIQSKCNEAAKTTNGETALHVAGNVEVVDYLLSIGLNVEDRDKDGYTPFLKDGETALHVAGNVEVVDYLLRIRLNIEDRDKCGLTPFLEACLHGNYVRCMFAFIADGETALHIAGNVEVVACLLESGLNIEYLDENGYTPFLEACRHDRLPVVQCLIQSKCNKAATTNSGETALHVAGNVEVVDYLLNIGLNIEDCDEDGYTPFLKACCDGHLPVVQRLIQSKCNKAATTNDGSTALHLICSHLDLKNDHLSVVKLLTSLRVDVSAKNNAGKTAMQAGEGWLLSVFGSHKKILSAILSHLKEFIESTVAVELPSCTSSTAIAATGHLSSPVTGGMRTTTPILRSPTEVAEQVNELVQHLIQQIEQVTQDGLAKDRQMVDLRQQITDLQKALRDEQLQREQVVAGERREKEHAVARERQEKEHAVARERQETEHAVARERQEKEQAVARERREKEELQQRLQREQEEKHDVQNDLDEARQQIEQLSVEKENVQQLLNEAEIEKGNVVELLSDADAAIERYKQERENEVFKIPSRDIQLTGTELGRGSYGAVYVGYWDGCPVAVKCLYDDLADVERYVQPVQQEASVAWKIHHPNIAAVCGVTLEKEVKKAWVIMELQSGSVSSVMDACQRDAAPLTVREKVDMAHDSLCGLDHIHSMQPMEILHGNICPRNILVTATMRAKLGDLGAARFQDASLSAGLLSLEYTAKERLDAPTLPKRKETDMYSLGVTLCELFTAVTPDRRKRMDQVLLVRQLNVRSLCKHLMRDNPATRPTAAEARRIISCIRDTDEYTACPPKRMVKGKMDGVADVTLVHPNW
ncbi:ankyrin repeat and KH domain-containing protein 1-like [Corticium candelabrum]|uniref:ankyrin repeat and KH domain-containing protein 1-like n=1 Tax=Corticium candelabrum TaxID=121492 RepID=UPI002E265756|nr:ankyrin repeat and KH domain-containing protein 1-like [Corticium candelabrum]